MTEERERYLTPGEVAELFRVDAKTVTRWAKPGPNGKPPKVPSVRTPGGHHRFAERDIMALLERSRTTVPGD